MICFKIQITDGKISSEDIAMFLKSGDALDKSDYKPKPSAEWLNEKMWTNLLALASHKFGQEQNQVFKILPDQISNQIDVWKKWAYEKMDPENYPVPEYEERIQNDSVLGMFLKLCLVRAIREDRVITTVQYYIKSVLGEQRYVDPISDSIESIEQASKTTCPVLFLLSAGADPTQSIDDLAKKKKKILNKVSLGEG